MINFLPSETGRPNRLTKVERVIWYSITGLRLFCQYHVLFMPKTCDHTRGGDITFQFIQFKFPLCSSFNPKGTQAIFCKYPIIRHLSNDYIHCLLITDYLIHSLSQSGHIFKLVVLLTPQNMLKLQKDKTIKSIHNFSIARNEYMFYYI